MMMAAWAGDGAAGAGGMRNGPHQLSRSVGLVSNSNRAAARAGPPPQRAFPRQDGLADARPPVRGLQQSGVGVPSRANPPRGRASSEGRGAGKKNFDGPPRALTKSQTHPPTIRLFFS
jgi:hypothetical protein